MESPLKPIKPYAVRWKKKSKDCLHTVTVKQIMSDMLISKRYHAFWKPSRPHRPSPVLMPPLPFEGSIVHILHDELNICRLSNYRENWYIQPHMHFDVEEKLKFEHSILTWTPEWKNQIEIKNISLCIYTSKWSDFIHFDIHATSLALHVIC